MKLTEQDLIDQCELIQDDLMCVLNGVASEILDRVCSVIVDRIAILKNKFNEPTDVVK